MMYAKQIVLGFAMLGGFLGGNPLIANSANLATHFYIPGIPYGHATTVSVPSKNQNNNSIAPETSAESNFSANWAGYIADNANTSYTAIGATWTVPAVANDTAGSAAAADATWVGIGGVSSQDLIQSGTQAVVQNGQVAYQAWVETLPNVLQSIPLTVKAGDSVTVSLAQQSPGQWGLSFHNNTTGQNYQTTVAYNSSNSSAEWIEEMPVGGSGNVLNYLPLDNFGSVTFQSGYAIANGTTQNIANADAQQISMVTSGNTLLASASALDQTGGGFTVTRSSASATIGATAPTSSGGRWHRTGVGYRRYTITSSTSSSSSPSSNSGSAQNVITNVSVTPGQWTVIPLSSGNAWLQILFR
jgi:Peptidase A4 family